MLPLLLLFDLQVSLRSTLAAGWAGHTTSTCGGRTHCQPRSSTLQVSWAEACLLLFWLLR
jgi:hypothetical protein